MSRFAALLLVAALGRFFILDGVAIGSLPAPAVEYIKAGLFGALLCAIIGIYLVFPQPPSPAKSIAGLAILIGVVESLMMSGCRLAWHLQGYQISDLPRGVSLCSASTGLPVREAVFALYFLILIYEIARCNRARLT